MRYLLKFIRVRALGSSLGNGCHRGILKGGVNLGWRKPKRNGVLEIPDRDPGASATRDNART